MLSEHCDEEAATAFFKQASNVNGFPSKVDMDKSGANFAGLENIGVIYIRLNSEKESVKQEAGKNQVGRIQIYYLYIEAYHAL